MGPWLQGRDSNPELLVNSQPLCHFTTLQQGEPGDGVDPSWLRYKGSAGAGRRGVVVRDGGLEPPPRWVRARRADPLQSRMRFGLEVSNPAGRLQRPASSPEAPDQVE